MDGSWPAGELTDAGEYAVDASEGKRRSKLTLLLYLSEGFDGGATTFYDARGGRGSKETAGAAAAGKSRRRPCCRGRAPRCAFPTATRRRAPCTRGRA